MFSLFVEDVATAREAGLRVLTGRSAEVVLDTLDDVSAIVFYAVNEPQHLQPILRSCCLATDALIIDVPYTTPAFDCLRPLPIHPPVCRWWAYTSKTQIPSMAENSRTCIKATPGTRRPGLQSKSLEYSV